MKTILSTPQNPEATDFSGHLPALVDAALQAQVPQCRGAEDLALQGPLFFQAEEGLIGFLTHRFYDFRENVLEDLVQERKALGAPMWVLDRQPS